MYGATTCEDTAVTRSRLNALGIPHQEIEIYLDPTARDRLSELGDGRSSTPTLVFGDHAFVAIEPSLGQLDDLLIVAGYAIHPPSAVEYHGLRASRPLPMKTLPAVGRKPFSLEQIKGSWQAALFFAHDATCLACFFDADVTMS